MYLPRIFEETNTETLHDVAEAHPFATLVVPGDEGPEIAHLPLLLERGEGGLGVLRGHVARANPIARRLDDTRVQAVFHGPHGYVSARWYEAPHEEVPTWNYVVVHAHGRLRAMDARELRDHLAAMAATFERDAAEPWSLDLLAPAFVDDLLAAIAGFTLTIERLEGKLKLSQNRSPADRARVLAALEERGTPDDLAMASRMRSAVPRG